LLEPSFRDEMANDPLLKSLHGVPAFTRLVDVEGASSL